MNKRPLLVPLTLVGAIVLSLVVYGISRPGDSADDTPKPATSNSSDAPRDPNSLEGKIDTAVRTQTTDAEASVNPSLLKSYKTLADGWYLATVNVPSETGSTSYALVRHDNDGGYTLMQEVTIHFDLAALKRLKVPDSVISQLPQESEGADPNE
ncbi:MAG: hypothetical protein JWM37_223 [Candidatus Saccharibacteria bacterium]|nr:hypothetical protein [Candidatus Saccharibacteria bacterium]